MQLLIIIFYETSEDKNVIIHGKGNVFPWYWYTFGNWDCLAYLSIYLSISACLQIFFYPYLPTPALGQDMTQGQFLSGV